MLALMHRQVEPQWHRVDAPSGSLFRFGTAELEPASYPLAPTPARTLVQPNAPRMLPAAAAPIAANDFAPAAALRPARPAGYALKRCIDIFGSTAALLFFAPLMLIVALLIWALDPGSVLYTQRRVGFRGRPFRILKFRTMFVDADRRLERLVASDPSALLEWTTRQKLGYDPRVTWFGRFLRLSSIDELPQLVNVLLGDMSLVGPRPIVDGESGRYGRYLNEYCAVRPGITGLWQVSGRNNTSYRRRVALDVAYKRQMSLAVDLGILARTVPAVISGEGAF
jgi:exopolysaccharide production protein ExoY